MKKQISKELEKELIITKKVMWATLIPIIMLFVMLFNITDKWIESKQELSQCQADLVKQDCIQEWIVEEPFNITAINGEPLMWNVHLEKGNYTIVKGNCEVLK